ncbi:putative aspartic peptidase domain superfamily [Helianthus anomalus]
MPKYAKLLKDLLKRKDKLKEISNVPLTADCSTVVMNKLPEKLTDSESLTISCLLKTKHHKTLNQEHVNFDSEVKNHVLADLGVSINLMPYSLYAKLGLDELTPTCMSLSLVDKSVKYPRGIVEKLLVIVDKFVFLWNL